MIGTKERQRRVVAKAYDGHAAINARLMNQVVGEGLAAAYEDVVALLEMDITPRDCQRLCGLSLNMIRAIAKERGMGGQRPGRLPTSVAPAFSTIPNQLWLSIFLDRLERLHSRSQSDFITGDVFLNALYATRMSCNTGAGELGGRYLMVAAEKFLKGDLYLTTCRCCGVRYAKSKSDLKLGVSSAGRHGACPQCKFIAWLRKADKHQMAALEDVIARESDNPDDLPNCNRKAPVKKPGMTLPYAAIPVI